MSLFQLGHYTLPSGRVSHFKIECDDLFMRDWDTLARLAVEILPPFHTVEGVPEGGRRFAKALEPYCATAGGLLIADDVWVTGVSWERYRANRPAFGVVAFARDAVPSWITPIFQLHPLAEKAAYRLDSETEVTGG